MWPSTGGPVGLSAADPAYRGGGVPPRAEALAAAADTGSLGSAAARTVLAAMAAEAARVGLRWPARLTPRSAAAPALASPPLPAVDSGG